MRKSQIEATIEWYFEVIEELNKLKIILLDAIEKMDGEEE
tara:strand:- start:962 stop:1081 length:120 start_codon:yes stop_codon:yes gene_type:complete